MIYSVNVYYIIVKFVDCFLTGDWCTTVCLYLTFDINIFVQEITIMFFVLCLQANEKGHLNTKIINSENFFFTIICSLYDSKSVNSHVAKTKPFHLHFRTCILLCSTTAQYVV